MEQKHKLYTDEDFAPLTRAELEKLKASIEHILSLANHPDTNKIFKESLSRLNAKLEALDKISASPAKTEG